MRLPETDIRQALADDLQRMGLWPEVDDPMVGDAPAEPEHIRAARRAEYDRRATAWD